MLKNYDRSALQTLNITGIWKKNVHNDRCDISSIYSARREQSDPCRNVDQHLQDNWATGRHKTMQTHVGLNLLYLSLCLKHAMCPCYATAAANAVTGP